MNPQTLLLALTLLIAPLGAFAEEPTSSAVAIDEVEDGLIRFKLPPESKLPKSMKVELYSIKVLGTLSPKEGGTPYFLLSARPCRECMQETAIYVVRPGMTKPQQFVYPGKVLDSKTRAVVLESRAFFGKCLFRRAGDVYVVFQKERVDRRRNLQSSVFIAEPGEDKLHEQLLERNFPSFKDTLALVKRKQCREVDGRYRLMVKKPLDIRSRNLKDEDDEEDEAPEKDDPAAGEADEAPIPADGARLVKPAR